VTDIGDSGGSGAPARRLSRRHWLAGVRGNRLVGANSGALAGMVIPIWMDGAGRPVDPPVSSGAAIAMGVRISIGTWHGAGVLLLILLKAGGTALDRRRRAEWDREWQRVAPSRLRQQ